DTTIAITGGEIPPKINGQSMPTWEALEIHQGDTLSFDFVKAGARIYIAVAGGIDVPLLMDSRATYTLCGLGGFEGRALQAGDVLSIGQDHVKQAQIGQRIDDKYIPKFQKQHEIRIIMGLCSYRLTD